MLPSKPVMGSNVSSPDNEYTYGTICDDLELTVESLRTKTHVYTLVVYLSLQPRQYF